MTLEYSSYYFVSVMNYSFAGYCSLLLPCSVSRIFTTIYFYKVSHCRQTSTTKYCSFRLHTVNLFLNQNLIMSNWLFHVNCIIYCVQDFISMLKKKENRCTSKWQSCWMAWNTFTNYTDKWFDIFLFINLLTSNVYLARTCNSIYNRWRQNRQSPLHIAQLPFGNNKPSTLDCQNVWRCSSSYASSCQYCYCYTSHCSRFREQCDDTRRWFNNAINVYIYVHLKTRIVIQSVIVMQAAVIIVENKAI